MKLYNTLSRKIEEFVPHDNNEVKLYTCGPTVYSYAHIGNLRNYIGHDILEKSLIFNGYNVKRCMNITDVGHLTSDADTGEDKMLKAAKKENKSSKEIADFYTKEFFKDFDKLNNKRPEIISNATDNIDEYIKIIEKLLEKDYAYISGGNVYFDVSKLDNYYDLSNLKEEEMAVGVRDDVTEDSNKKNQVDFVLWFTTSKFENHELLWDSPFGRGYPGWHIECTGISIKYLGEYLDIHGGGIDNIFPHHSNEIAQSEAYLGHKWCNYWFHNEHLIDETGKMSKSNGAILTVSKLEEEGFDPLSFRFMCLNSHYRKQLLFSYDALSQSESTLNKIRNKVKSIVDDGEIDNNKFNNYTKEFKECLNDDLNTSNAISVLYKVLKDNELNGKTKISIISRFDDVLSLDLFKTNKVSEELKEKVNKLIEKRNELKKEKKYEEADKIRDEILSLGVNIKDTRNGVEIIWS